MQIQDLINAAGKAAKENRMRDTMQLTLGKLIETQKHIKANEIRRKRLNWPR